jgi:hypothetical protein
LHFAFYAPFFCIVLSFLPECISFFFNQGLSCFFLPEMHLPFLFECFMRKDFFTCYSRYLYFSILTCILLFHAFSLADLLSTFSPGCFLSLFFCSGVVRSRTFSGDKKSQRFFPRFFTLRALVVGQQALPVTVLGFPFW